MKTRIYAAPAVKGLTLKHVKALNYVYKPRKQRVFQFEIILNFLVTSFRFIWYGAGLRPLKIFYTYIAGIDIMTSESDVHRHQILSSKIGSSTERINPCPAELLELYFSSFEAGIANAISSFKWRKILLFMKNRHV